MDEVLSFCVCACVRVCVRETGRVPGILVHAKSVFTYLPAGLGCVLISTYSEVVPDRWDVRHIETEYIKRE